MLIVRGCRGGGTHGKNCGDVDLVSQPRFTGDDLQNHLILSYNYYIRILAIITKFVISITCILCCG